MSDQIVKTPHKKMNILLLTTVFFLTMGSNFAHAGTDMDGIPDAWEILYGLDPNDSTDAALDLDGDGLSNLDEFLNDTFPNDKDSDDDGINDKTEVFYSFDPINASSTPALEHVPRMTHTYSSSISPDNFYNAGKVDGDEIDDYIVTESGSSQIHIYSGANDSLIRTIVGPNSGRFGSSVDLLDDYDADNINDLLIGAPSENSFTGAVYIVSAGTGNILATLNGSNVSEQFGSAVVALNDINSDNVNDFVIGARGHINNGLTNAGKIEFRSGVAPFNVIRTIVGSARSDQLGSILSSGGDTNNDGIDDVFAAQFLLSIQLNNVLVFSGADATELFRFNGTSFKNIKDVTGDGISDLIIGNPASNNDTGNFILYSGSQADALNNGNPIFGHAISGAEGANDDDQFGTSVSGVGDINGDGIEDVIAGAPGTDVFEDRVQPGYANIYSPLLNNVNRATLISSFIGDTSARKFGDSVSGIGDVNQDGIGDFIVGAQGTVNNGVTTTGIARVYISGLEAVDVTPDSFSFIAQTNLAASTLTASNTINITGIDSPVSISVSNGEMSIDDGAYSAITTTVSANQTVQVRGTSSATSLSTTSVVLTVSGVSARFDMTTGDVVAPDITAPSNIILASPLSTIDVNILSNGAATAIDDVDANPVITHDQSADSVNFAVPGTYTVIWTATDSAGNSSNTSQTITLTSRALEADLSVALSADVNAAVEGDNITYTIAITNNGVDSASNVSAIFSLPGNTNLVSNSAECIESAGVVTCNQANLNNSAQASFNIVVQTTQAETLNASVSVSADEADANAGNNSANNSITVIIRVFEADLSVALSTDVNAAVEGDSITYTIAITNNGVDSASNVSAIFTLPGNTNLVSNSAECNESAGVVTCSQANLNNSAQASFNIVVQTTQAETLNASVNVSADEVDANAGNNSANNSITVESAVANLVTELSRTGATIIDVNETVTSTLKITNNGNAVAGNVSVNVRIESYSNPDLQFTDIDLAQCSADGQQNLGSRVFDVYNCDLGDINPAQSVELIISATAPAESSEFIAIMSISATSLGSMEENISIRSSGTVEVDEGGGGSGSINSLLLFLLALPIIISRRFTATSIK